MLGRVLLAALILVCFAGASAAQETQYGRYHALVIGNNDYVNLDNLKTAVNDASVVADVLRRDYGFEVELLLNANRYDTVTALNKLRAKLTPNDNFLIYYAGHGVLDEVTGTGYWLPVDAESDNNANWIPNSTVTDNIAAIPAKHILVVADSCYSGSLSRGIVAKLRIGAERDEWLARMARKRSRTLLASGGLEPVADAGGGGHSVFAGPFIEALRDNRKILDTQSLYDTIKHKVVLAADQTPRYDDIRKAGHDGGDFLFVPVKLSGLATAGAPRQAASAPTADLEITFWNSIKDDDDRAMFEAYLEQFPNGTFARLARRNIEKAEERRKAEEERLLAEETLFWQSINDSADPALFEAYLEQFPNGAFTGIALRNIEIARESAVAAVAEPERSNAAGHPFDGKWQASHDYWEAELDISGSDVTGSLFNTPLSTRLECTGKITIDGEMTGKCWGRNFLTRTLLGWFPDIRMEGAGGSQGGAQFVFSKPE